tara:strand:+ start:1183 stop:1359 length:177 start_codon:yes stop_codon:yes gene_type:complete
MIKEITKLCTRCRKEKTLEKFNNNKSKHDGKQSQCGLCQSQTVSECRERNKLKRANYG